MLYSHIYSAKKNIRFLYTGGHTGHSHIYCVYTLSCKIPPTLWFDPMMVIRTFLNHLLMVFSTVSSCTCLCFVHRLGLSRLVRTACLFSHWVKTIHHSLSQDLGTDCCDSDALWRTVLLIMLTSTATVGLYKVRDRDRELEQILMVALMSWFAVSITNELLATIWQRLKEIETCNVRMNSMLVDVCTSFAVSKNALILLWQQSQI